ncbi:uncharacterized [Tachysurus ichikawai]
MHTPVEWIRKTGDCPSAPVYKLQLEENVTHLWMSSDIQHNTAVTFPCPLKDSSVSEASRSSRAGCGSGGSSSGYD